MTYKEFDNNINLGSLKNRDLETYLLALLKLVEQEREQVLTADLLLKLLQDACTSKPKKFNVEWLKIKDAPDENTFINSKTNSSTDKTIISDIGEFYYTIAVLQFQIAELHKMKGKQLDDNEKYFGIDSETGNRWYNFDPGSILDCGMRCFMDHNKDDDQEFEVSWRTLGDLLEMGRIYE
ncbi:MULTISPECIES: hypothetical protein [Chryseobacterium]|uniref:hypothetical protein n=1 Tax=Chryseobacterium TaxID=59732 RepID=UPI000C9E941C|nr:MULTISPECIES: hypothetical protein [Chryseobacterium]VXC10885.1 conserved hypothetical protein [Chryseobacterium sp. 8AT]